MSDTSLPESSKIDSRNRPLHRIFTAVPRRYDLINRLVTWCLDERWRLKAAQACLASHPHHLLDLCCGTGDLAIRLGRLVEGDIELVAIDYSQPMLALAAKKAKRSRVCRIAFIHADVANLPFPDGHFDSIGISFAFRNLTYKNPRTEGYLAEIVRILSTGGRFVCVETSQPRSKVIRRLFHLYLRWFVYGVGRLISGNKTAYRYMAESAARFHGPAQVNSMLRAAGFSAVRHRGFLLGAIGLYVALK